MSQHAVVIKIGTSTLTAPRADHSLYTQRFKSLANQIELHVRNAGFHAVLVSSGAIGLGIDQMAPGSTRSDVLQGLSDEERDVRLRTFASVGQTALIGRWQESFGRTPVSQHLVTNRELKSDEAEPFARTLFDCLRLGIVPVINENDGISDEEIKVGDNDTLAARVAVALHQTGEYQTTRLVLLTDVDGFYWQSEPGEQPIMLPGIAFDELDLYMDFARGAGQNGTGGMRTKLEAAKIAGQAGIETTIANGESYYAMYNVMMRRTGTHVYIRT